MPSSSARQQQAIARLKENHTRIWRILRTMSILLAGAIGSSAAIRGTFSGVSMLTILSASWIVCNAPADDMIS
jgi:hypothetical protein